MIFNIAGAGGPMSGFKESESHPDCFYHTVDGTVEWLNPPMAVGVEYRTTERHFGRVVYAKKCNLGNLPNTSTKAITSLAADVYEMVDDYITVYSASNSYTKIPEITLFYTAANGGIPYCSITTSADVSSMTAYLTIKYTKG